MGNLNNVTVISLIAGAIEVNARYAAYNFYQSRKGEPLTPEEMEEIANGVLNDIGKSASQMAATLVNVAADDD